MISFLKQPALWVGLLLALLLFALQPVQAVKRLETGIGQPFLVQIHADWCPTCRYIDPTLQKLKKTYQGKVRFVTLNVTNRKTMEQAKINAGKVGLGSWFEANRSKTGLVTIIMNGEVIKNYVAVLDETEYTTVLDPLINRK